MNGTFDNTIYLNRVSVYIVGAYNVLTFTNFYFLNPMGYTHYQTISINLSLSNLLAFSTYSKNCCANKLGNHII